MSIAWFRFYEELNDFLPPVRRRQLFSFSFSGNPSVKDTIEALGVPHVEIDMVLVNGESVDFTYKLRNEDRVSVYPVFENIDISNVTRLRKEPLRVMKFVTDVHLGKLTKYLRLCGFDTYNRSDLADTEIIRIALNERRVILTRDKELLKSKRVTHGYWIRSQSPDEQLKELLNRLDLRKLVKPFTRCMECNGMLTFVPKEEISEKLLPKTLEFYQNFKICPGCKRIYWEGSHFNRMKEKIERISNLNLNEESDIINNQ